MNTPRSTGVPPRSLNRQQVLDEDEYINGLSHIIARDFFPSLVHLDATNNYLDSLRSEDPELIDASVRRLQELRTPSTQRRAPYQTPSQTPYAAGPSDTPLSLGTPRHPGARGPAERVRYDTAMSLDAFQARYTSEDNSSFTEILDEENRKRREKWAWAWEAQRRVEAQRVKMIEGRERMVIDPASVPGVRERLVIEPPTPPAGLITAGEDQDMEDVDEDMDEEEREEQKEVALLLKEGDAEPGTVAVVSTEGGVVDVMARKKDTRPAGVDGWKFKARNALMFSPDADISPYDPSASGSNQLPKLPKVVKYDSTRMAEQDDRPDRSMPEPPSPTRSRIDAAISGTPYRPRSPTINNFSFVPALPTLTPSALGPDAVKELMTWGTLDATPRILSRPEDQDPAASITADSPFHLPAMTSREALSHKLSNKAAKSLRARADLLNGTTPRAGGSAAAGKKKSEAMAPPSWTPRKADIAGSLTPAARRLLDRSTLGTAAARRAEVMGRTSGWEGSKGKEKDISRVRWTPTPSPVTRREM